MAGVLQLIVETRAGTPLSDARVYYIETPTPMPEICALTNDQGHVIIDAPVPGDYRIGISADGFMQRVLEIKVGEEPVTHHQALMEAD